MSESVLIVSNHGEIVGGGEVSLLALLKGLDRSRWAPDLVVPSDGGVAARARALGFSPSVIALPTLRRPGPAMIESVIALRRLARETGASLLHANGSRAMVYAGFAGRLVGRPVIWHVRVAHRDPLLDRVLFRLAASVVVPSGAVARRFSWAPPEKLHRIVNGVDLAQFTPRHPSSALAASLALPDGVPVVGSVGRFVPYKGFAQLLKAALLVRNVRPEAHWLLVGDGPLREDLMRQCRLLGLDHQVHWTGWREDVPDLLALCDLFVLPSLGEHFGRVLIEGMAMGLAVVATGAGGVPEIVSHEETGLLVSPADPRALADAVVRLLKEPGLAMRLGAAGQRRANAEFSLSRHAGAVEALYRALMGSHHV